MEIVPISQVNIQFFKYKTLNKQNEKFYSKKYQ